MSLDAMLAIGTGMDIRTIKEISTQLNDIGLKAVESEERILCQGVVYELKMEEAKKKHEQSKSSPEEWEQYYKDLVESGNKRSDALFQIKQKVEECHRLAQEIETAIFALQ